MPNPENIPNSNTRFSLASTVFASDDTPVYPSAAASPFSSSPLPTQMTYPTTRKPSRPSLSSSKMPYETPACKSISLPDLDRPITLDLPTKPSSAALLKPSPVRSPTSPRRASQPFADAFASRAASRNASRQNTPHLSRHTSGRLSAPPPRRPSLPLSQTHAAIQEQSAAAAKPTHFIARNPKIDEDFEDLESGALRRRLKLNERFRRCVLTRTFVRRRVGFAVLLVGVFAVVVGVVWGVAGRLDREQGKSVWDKQQ